MATIKGKWVFKDESPTKTVFSKTATNDQNSYNYEEVNFTSLGVTTRFILMAFHVNPPIGTPTVTNKLIYAAALKDINNDGVLIPNVTWTAYDYLTNSWKSEEFRTVEFGNVWQEVSDEFVVWFTANAIPIDGESSLSPILPTDAVSIVYSNSIIASLRAGQSATLSCKDILMHTDLVVTVPEGMGAGEVVEEWDGSYTVTDAVKLISFTINEIGYPIEYQAVSGMTWAEWCESDYDISPADPDDSYSVGDSGAYVWKKSGNTLTNWSVHNGDGTNVNPSDVIQAGVVYSAYANSGSND
jgi:hypothetical protein